MANGYIPIQFPSFCYSANPNEPARVVQNTADLATLNATPTSTLPGASAPVRFGFAVAVVPAQPAQTPQVIVNGTAHRNIQDAQTRRT